METGRPVRDEWSHPRVTHHLKIEPFFFQAVKNGTKTFEIRYDDRNYQMGDILILREWDGYGYTGDVVTVQVTFMTIYRQQPGYVVMAIRKVERNE